MLKLKNTSNGEIVMVVQTKTKCVLVQQAMQSVYCVPVRRLNMCRWMALLSLAIRWGRTKHKTKRNIFRHIQTKNVYIFETSELAERQLYAQTETKWLVARQVMQ